MLLVRLDAIFQWNPKMNTKDIRQNRPTQASSFNELEQFAHLVSHDLKSPLRNIGSYAQLLKRRYYNHLDSDANDFLDYIVSNAKVMTDILTDLLELSTIDDDNEVRTVTNFNDLFERVKLDLKATIHQNDAIIECDTPLPTLRVQCNSISLLMHHLIENSVKFRNGMAPHILISAQPLDNLATWQFSVKDNGVGLDESYHEKAFQPFQRLTNRERPGSGMGLAICRKVVRLHGGDIWYNRNHNDDGTTFHFTIPQ